MTLHESKKKKLVKKGWKVGTTEDFLQLSAEESAYIELKLKLADDLRIRRQKMGLTQMKLARLMNSSQSRVAKMEAGDPTVSLDLLIRSLLSLGTSRQELGKVVASPRNAKAS